MFLYNIISKNKINGDISDGVNQQNSSEPYGVLPISTLADSLDMKLIP